MSLSTRVIEELQWWADELQAWDGKSIISTHDEHIRTTDASHHGLGCWWRRVNLQGHRIGEARGFFSRHESKMSSNSRKLTVVSFRQWRQLAIGRTAWCWSRRTTSRPRPTLTTWAGRATTSLPLPTISSMWPTVTAFTSWRCTAQGPSINVPTS